jgi:hypothetical protein
MARSIIVGDFPHLHTAPAPTLIPGILIIAPMSPRTAAPLVIRTANDVRKYAKTYDLKHSSFLIQGDLTKQGSGQAKQTKATFSAIKRITGRTLPLFRPIQVHGYHADENGLVPLTLSRRDNEQGEINPIDVALISDMKDLLEFRQLNVVLRKASARPEPNTLVYLAYINGGEKKIQAYTTQPVMPDDPSDGLTLRLQPEEIFLDEYSGGTDLGFDEEIPPSPIQIFSARPAKN